MKLLKTSIMSISIMLLTSTAFAGPLTSAGGRVSARSVYVVFNSIGGGINHQALEIYEAKKAEAEANGQVIMSSYVQKGREGEAVACIFYRDAAYRNDVIYAVAPVILQENETITEVYVGFDCNDIQTATKQDLTKYVN